MSFRTAAPKTRALAKRYGYTVRDAPDTIALERVYDAQGNVIGALHPVRKMNGKAVYAWMVFTKYGGSVRGETKTHSAALARIVNVVEKNK